jgi:DNA-binding NtrC family response regulator
MKQKLLLVEDSRAILRIMLGCINSDVFDVTVSETFEEAEKCLRESCFDLIVTDFDFQGGNGTTVARIARQNGSKIILLHTGDMDEPKIDQALFDKCFDKLDRTLLKILGAKQSWN